MCVLGCFSTDRGIRIKNEMLTWIKSQFNVVVCNQVAHSRLFEYPAIKLAMDIARTKHINVLYLHTKGAGNPIPYNYKTSMMAPSILYPHNACPEDCQRIVRLMWKKEFSVPNIHKYLAKLQCSNPVVACPFSGPEHITWQNGWLMNQFAADLLNSKFHFSTDRYYYEQVFTQIPEITMHGLLLNDFTSNEAEHKRLWDLIWSYWDDSIHTMV
jgi:hypothetical protein